MAYCPKCKGEIGTTAVTCSHCGYDFPSTDLAAANKKDGFEYSRLADIALIVSTIAAATGVGVAALASIVFIWHRQYLNGLILGPLACFIQLGMLVVFLRIQDR